MSRLSERDRTASRRHRRAAETRVTRAGMPAASSFRRSRATRSWCRSRSAELALRCWMLARAPAAMAGGSEVVKMKPEAKLRMKSQSGTDPVM